VPDHFKRLADRLAAMLPVNQDVARTFHSVAHERNLQQLLFGNKTSFPWHVSQGCKNVEMALMVRHQHEPAQTFKMIEPFDFDMYTTCPNDESGPQPPNVGHAVAIEEGRRNRGGYSQEERVENGKNRRDPAPYGAADARRYFGGR
jgi:hypothetical protein